jgi:isoleucyl-tRNA synthetase
VPENMCSKDVKALAELYKFKNKMKESYDKYDFRNLFNLMTAYVSNTSKSYFDLETKELLYEGESNGEGRRNRQFVMNKMLNELVKLFAPLTPYLCEDVYSFMEEDSSVFMLEIE